MANTIIAENLNQATQPANIPPVPALTPVPPPLVQANNGSSDINGILNMYTDNAPQSMEGQYNQNMTNANISGLSGDVATAQNAVNQETANLATIQAQLAAISGAGTQAQLQLEGGAKGKDVTTAFLGRQQQEVARQAGIQALPLQAQALASQAKIQGLQGNAEAAQTLLSQAQSQVDKLFSIQSQDAQNMFQYKQKLIDRVYQLADKKEQALLDEKKMKNEQDFLLNRDKIQNEYQTQRDAIRNQQDIYMAKLNASLEPTTSSPGSNIITTPDGQQVDISPLDDNFSYATTNFTKDQRNNALATYNGFISKGNIEGANKYIEKLIIDKLSPTQKDAITTMGTVETQIDKILSYNSDGKLEGVGFISGPIGSLATKVFGTGSKEAQDVRALVGNIKGTIAKLRGGTSFTTNEEKLLNSYTPTINESANSVINKLALLKDFIASQKNKTLHPFESQTSAENTNNNSLRTKYNY